MALIIITGGAKGIGKTLAETLSKNNLVNIIDYDKKALSLIKNKNITTHELDVSNYSEVKSTIKKIYKDNKTIDVLINCAAVVEYAEFIKMPKKQWDKIININLGGYFNCGQIVAQLMKKNKNGKIINISSISGSYAIPGQCAYASSKAAINALTRSMALELGKYNILVNGIAPGTIIVDRNKKKFTDSKYKKEFLKKTSIKRLGNPSDLVGLIKFLISKESNYITGQIFTVDGGLTTCL